MSHRGESRIVFTLNGVGDGTNFVKDSQTLGGTLKCVSFSGGQAGNMSPSSFLVVIGDRGPVVQGPGLVVGGQGPGLRRWVFGALGVVTREWVLGAGGRGTGTRGQDANFESAVHAPHTRAHTHHQRGVACTLLDLTPRTLSHLKSQTFRAVSAVEFVTFLAGAGS